MPFSLAIVLAGGGLAIYGDYGLEGPSYPLSPYIFLMANASLLLMSDFALSDAPAIPFYLLSSFIMALWS